MDFRGFGATDDPNVTTFTDYYATPGVTYLLPNEGFYTDRELFRLLEHRNRTSAPSIGSVFPYGHHSMFRRCCPMLHSK